MRRLLLPLCCSLALIAPAWAQFEVMDPKDTVLPPAGGVLFTGHYADYLWTSESVLTRQIGNAQDIPLVKELLLIETGVAKAPGSPPATAIHRLAGGATGLRRLGPPFLVEGEYDTSLIAEFTSDDADELLVRTEVTATGMPIASAVPYSGRPPAAGSTVRRTTVVSFEADTNRVLMLLQQDAPSEVTEFPGVLPTDSGNDLVIASFGGHAGGTTAAPDAWLRYRFMATGKIGGKENQGMVRQPDLVMTPIPITALRTVDLTGSGTEQLVSLRSFPSESYWQQLWAQHLNPTGFFENSAIGRGNDLQLLPVTLQHPGIFFLWNDVKAKVPRTHLTSLHLDAANKPQQQLDLSLPSIVSLKGAAWGQTRPNATNPQLGMLLRPAALEETWLGVVTFGEKTDASDTAPLMSFITHPSFSGLTSLAAFDLNGDGLDDWIGVGSDGLLAYDPLRATINAHVALEPVLPTSSGEVDLFSLLPQ